MFSKAYCKEVISNNGAPMAYTYDLNVPAGIRIIEVQAGNVGTGRNPFVDFVTYLASGSGSTDPGGHRDADGVLDTEDNCPDVYSRHQVATRKRSAEP
jgi:hypothetical protein